MLDADQLWVACLAALRAQVPDATWVSCFQPTVAVTITDDVLVVAVPSSLVKERIEGQWLDLVTRSLSSLGAADIHLDLQVRPEAVTPELFPGVGAPSKTTEPHDVEHVGPPQPEHIRTARELQIRDHGRFRSTPAQALNPRYTFEAFVTGASNRFAHAAALSVAETPARSYNPLFIYGVAGLGKTHLLHAIAHYVHENYQAFQVRYVSTESFMNDYVESIRSNTASAFKRHYRENDVLLVDDIQFMEGKEGLQEEFFHTFNQLHGANRQIVISSDRPPRSIATLEDRLRSRFEWGLITDIQPPELETRLAILRKKAEREPLSIPDDVLEFIATNITNNIRELEGALIRVTAFSSLNREPLSMDLAASVLGDSIGDTRSRVITARVILETTAEMFDFSIDELCGKSRRRPLVIARQIGMYVCREMTDLSYPAIAREYGGRDHTTVIHAVEKIGALMKERRQIYDQVTELMHKIRNAGP